MFFFLNHREDRTADKRQQNISEEGDKGYIIYANLIAEHSTIFLFN
jgi:hypothetical protein